MGLVDSRHERRDCRHTPGEGGEDPAVRVHEGDLSQRHEQQTHDKHQQEEGSHEAKDPTNQPLEKGTDWSLGQRLLTDGRWRERDITCRIHRPHDHRLVVVPDRDFLLFSDLLLVP